MPDQRNRHNGTTLADRSSSRLFLERFDPWFETYPNLFWFMLSASFGAVSLSLGFAVNAADADAYFGVTLPLCVGFVSVPLAFKFCHRQLKEWTRNLDNFVVADANSLRNWFQDEFAFLYRGSKWMIFWGIAVGSSAVAAYYHGNYMPASWSSASVFGFVLIFGSAFLAGAGLFGIFCATRAFARLARFAVRVERHKFGVLSTGNMLLKVYAAIAIVWIFYVLSAVIGHAYSDFWDLMMEPPMWLLAGPTVPFILGGFVISQFPLHQRMLEYKKNEVLRIEKLLEPLRFKRVKDLTQERRARFDFLERRKTQILSLPEWPFSLTSFLGAFGLSLSANVPLAFAGIKFVVS